MKAYIELNGCNVPIVEQTFAPLFLQEERAHLISLAFACTAVFEFSLSKTYSAMKVCLFLHPLDADQLKEREALLVFFSLKLLCRHLVSDCLSRDACTKSAANVCECSHSHTHTASKTKGALAPNSIIANSLTCFYSNNLLDAECLVACNSHSPPIGLCLCLFDASRFLFLWHKALSLNAVPLLLNSFK